ncbi:glycosyltransferase [Alicycliphilus denitrificans]|uniref:glycosyltransferase n=1 Tax=Alicycliphilus denitrificans TaxID=179636 RepID=UPI0019167313|nr:glycosyltransferase [Alicycliphilus denitrificans]MBN9576679.1 glycosyltransferase [Alicycliphilus denitrificans]
MNSSLLHPAGPLVVSMVSHGHAALVQPLLEAVARLSAASVSRVVLTQNLPEADPQEPPGGWPFTLQVRRNARPAGFGTNHNRALAGAREPFVCVLNPDVVLSHGDPFADLVRTAGAAGVGCAYPHQVDAMGRVQDSERALPTLLALWRRRVLGRPSEVGTPVEWVNGACMVLPRPVWEAMGGFDERYFMYCEDVDLCLRLRLAGLALVRAPVRVQHAGQRASRRAWRPLWWHVCSLLRLWASPVFWRARRLLPPHAAPANRIDAS